jgi:hypothetical protein
LSFIDAAKENFFTNNYSLLMAILNEKYNNILVFFVGLSAVLRIQSRRIIVNLHRENLLHLTPFYYDCSGHTSFFWYNFCVREKILQLI